MFIVELFSFNAGNVFSAFLLCGGGKHFCDCGNV